MHITAWGLHESFFVVDKSVVHRLVLSPVGSGRRVVHKIAVLVMLVLRPDGVKLGTTVALARLRATCTSEHRGTCGCVGPAVFALLNPE